MTNTEDVRPILDEWLKSCTRRGKLSRNTIAVGIVVLDSLRVKCPLERSEILSAGGEIKGARSGLPKVLGKYGLSAFLKEATTRQVHQDGQKLLHALGFGKIFASQTDVQRDDALQELINVLTREASKWLARQNLKIACARDRSPRAWIGEILTQAQGRSGGRVEQHLVGAKLTEVYPGMDIPVLPGAAGDAQTGRAGDFQIGTTVFHVTAAPGDAVVRKAETNHKAGLHPVLLVPKREEARANFVVEHLGMADRVTVLAIEDFFSVNIVEKSKGQRHVFVETLKRIIREYNRRIEQAETDKSLRIDII